MHLGIYVHIPFCVRKCAYCDFASYANRTGDMPRYVNALCDEIRARAQETGRLTADTVFFGGGTPSLLPPELFEKIVHTLRECYDFAPDTEFTVETNPGTLTKVLADTMVQCGVNRLSMGMQCAQEHLLMKLGRIHSLQDVHSAVKIAREAGINNLNLDLMLGLPQQTKDDMQETLREALALSPDHISCYALIVEEGTPLCRDIDSGKYTLPGDDLDREMYEMCRETLTQNGFHQYEISNFAREGRACRHNVNCWQYQPYLGFGCAAHGFLHDTRRANVPSLDDYLRGAAPETEIISKSDAMFECVMLGLRLTRGIEEARFMQLFGVSLWDTYGGKLQKAVDQGNLRREDGYVYLTRHGMDVMNSVLVELL